MSDAILGLCTVAWLGTLLLLVGMILVPAEEEAEVRP